VLLHWTREYQTDRAYKLFVELRKRRADFMTCVEFDVYVPWCGNCCGREQRQLEENCDPPDINPATWEKDLREFGVVQEEIERIIRGWPVMCYRCGQKIRYDGSDGVYVKSVPFAVYFEGLLEGGRKKLQRKVYQAYGGACFGCKRKVCWKERSIDHIRPQKPGNGRRAGTDELLNLQLLCKECDNEVKRNKEPKIQSFVFHFPLVPTPSDAYEGVVW